MKATELKSHVRNDKRLLALHEEVVRLVKSDPGIIDKALSNIKRWIQAYHDADAFIPGILNEWETILKTQTIDEICDLVLMQNERGQSLRQSSPFAGIISSRTRNMIFESYTN